MNWPKKVLQAEIESLVAQREKLESKLAFVNDEVQRKWLASQSMTDPPDELANLRADLDAAWLEWYAALEREGELQRRIHNLQVETDGYRIELLELDRLRTVAKNLRANCDLFQRERDQAVAELDKLRGLSDAYRNRALINLKDRDEARAELKKLRASIQSSPMDSTPGTC